MRKNRTSEGFREKLTVPCRRLQGTPMQTSGCLRRTNPSPSLADSPDQRKLRFASGEIRLPVNILNRAEGRSNQRLTVCDVSVEVPEHD